MLNETQNIPIKSELKEMIEELKEYQGKGTTIYITETVEAKYDELTKENIQEKIYGKAESSLVHVLGKGGE
jgi:predicted DNA-binding protein